MVSLIKLPLNIETTGIAMSEESDEEQEREEIETHQAEGTNQVNFQSMSLYSIPSFSFLTESH